MAKRLRVMSEHSEPIKLRKPAQFFALLHPDDGGSMFFRPHEENFSEETISYVRKFGNRRIKRPKLLPSTILQCQRLTQGDSNPHNESCISGGTNRIRGS
jgi:hypothetical protein